jgi:Flp pilus assembly pilin Flp
MKDNTPVKTEISQPSASEIRKSRKERGQGMAEYIIIVILIAIIVLVGVRLFGKSVINQFNNATGEIDTLKTP